MKHNNHMFRHNGILNLTFTLVMGLMVSFGNELIRFNPANNHIEYSTSKGSCWIGAFSPAAVSEAFDIPTNEHPVAILPLGYPAEGCKPSDRHASFRPEEEMIRDR